MKPNRFLYVCAAFFAWLITTSAVTALDSSIKRTNTGKPVQTTQDRAWPAVKPLNKPAAAAEHSISKKARTIAGGEPKNAAPAGLARISRNQSPTVPLTDKERAWLKEHKVIRIGVDADYGPYSFRANNGRYRGIAMEFASHIGRLLGIRMEVVPGLDWPEIVAGVRERSLDVVMTMSHRPAREAFVNFTEIYLPTPLVIMRRYGNDRIQSEDDLDGNAVAMVEGYSSSERVMEEHPRARPIKTKTALEGLFAVATGKAAAYVGVLGVNLYLTRQYGINNLEVASLYGEGANGQRFGVRKDWPELAAILDKVLEVLPREQKQTFFERWVPAQAMQLPSRELTPVAKETFEPNIAIALSGMAALVFLGLMAFMFRASREESLSRRFGSPAFRRGVIIAQAVFVIVAIILTLSILDYNRQQLSKARQVELEVVLKTTVERLRIWRDTQKLILEELANDFRLLDITERLLSIPPIAEALKGSPVLEVARQYDMQHLENFGDVGFFIINRDRISIGSMRDANLGTVNLIEQQRPDLMKRAFGGETVFVQPIISDVPVGNQAGKHAASIPTMFFATPVRNRDGQVIAVLAKRLDPIRSFSRVLQFGRFGNTGETYAFKQDGRLFSESRFNHHLVQLGQLKSGQHSSLNIQIRDPGGNLLDGYQPLSPRDDLPLTRMAKTAVRGVAGVDMAGYRDYRGVSVVGAWLWDDSMKMGLATEMDLEEAFAAYYVMRWTMLGVLGLLLVIAVGGATFTLFVGERAQLLLRERQQRLSGIMDNVVDGIVTFDEQGIVETFNHAAELIFGYQAEEIHGQNVSVLLPEPENGHNHADLENYLRTLKDRGDSLEPREVAARRKDGSIFPMNLAVSVMEIGNEQKFIGIVRDITQSKENELQLRQSQKMDAIGQLTGGVAHDFNNLLTAIIGNIEMVKQVSGDGSNINRRLDIALRASFRGADLTKRLLTFSRKGELKPELTDLNKIIPGTIELLERTLGEDIRIKTSLVHGLWPTLIDQSLLENALLNLAVNARDAMFDGGHLTIETANRALDEKYAEANEGVIPGEYVMLAVSDTGFGMSEETIEHVFEPFYTTKEIGKGTGLGLSMVFGFVKQSGGHVKVYSEEGHGTTIRLYFPRSLATGEAKESHREAPTGILVGNETILVVEDDPDVRAFVVAALEEIGYKILAADNGPMALGLLDDRPHIDLLLTDVVMPGGMNGVVLADEVRKRYPGIKVLYTSGYTRNAITHQGGLNENEELLAKPYSRVELSQTLRRVLGDAA